MDWRTSLTDHHVAIEGGRQTGGEPAIGVLVVCTGNICRSPTGEGVLRHLAKERGLAERVRIASAGTHDYHVGDAPDPRTVKHASKRGYDLSMQRAMLVEKRHFDEFDYILAMDRGHLRILKQMQPHGSRAKLGLFLEASARWKGEDVPDPYYGGDAEFEQVLDMVEEAGERWLDRIAAELDPSTFRLQSAR
jgi:protein-tyrosine phosphatase